VQQLVITGVGLRKLITAQDPFDLAVAVAVAKLEVRPKTPDINDKTFGNKRDKDL
jgi:hypothetical protein